MTNQYNGPDRRNNDSLITMMARIEERQISHMKLVEQHILDDDKSFELIKKDVNLLQRIIYMGLGGVALLQFVLETVK